MTSRALPQQPVHQSDDEQLAAALCAACGASVRTRHLAVGQSLFRTGAAVRYAFIVRSGQVRLLRHSNDGAQVTLHVANASGCVAEASLFATRYHCDAVANAPSTVVALPKVKLLAALRADDQLSYMLLATLARQVQALRGQIGLLNERSASKRVLMYLQTLQADRAGFVRVASTWKSLATEIGLSHEVVYRALRSLEQAGDIERIDSLTVRLPSRP